MFESYNDPGSVVTCLYAVVRVFLRLRKVRIPKHTSPIAYIRKVEDGVDDFRDWAKKQGENAQSRAQSAQSSGQTPRRSGANTSSTQARQDQAKNTKNDLEDALDDLNRSTNRLRRKFDATDKWVETKVQVEQVVEDWSPH